MILKNARLFKTAFK